MYIRYLISAPLDLISCILALILSPFTSFLVDKNGDLKFLRIWLRTPDSNMFGNPGDAGFYERNKSKLDSYLGRVWVCFLWQWRNTAQGFSQNILGFDSSGYREISRKEISKDKYNYEFIVGQNSSLVKSFQFKGSYYWNEKKRFRWNLGWKLNMTDTQSKAMIVVSIGPYTNR